jgi:hypothetical protein
MNEQSVWTYRPLFGHYFLELQKFFASFNSSKVDQNGNQIKPIVIMGTPTATFRKITSPNTNISSTNPSSYNGVVNLPVINFIVSDFRRVFAQENPYARYSMPSYNTNNFGTKEVMVGYSPQTWDLTFQVSVWTDTLKERDDLMSKIMTSFRPDLNLKHYPDPIGYPKQVLWMTFKIDESFTDETNNDDLQEKETKKLIRSSFGLICSAILPYDSEYIPLIEQIEILQKVQHNNDRRYVWNVENVDDEEIIIFSSYAL